MQDQESKSLYQPHSESQYPFNQDISEQDSLQNGQSEMIQPQHQYQQNEENSYEEGNYTKMVVNDQESHMIDNNRTKTQYMRDYDDNRKDSSLDKMGYPYKKVKREQQPHFNSLSMLKAKPPSNNINCLISVNRTANNIQSQKAQAYQTKTQQTLYHKTKQQFAISSLKQESTSIPLTLYSPYVKSQFKSETGSKKQINANKNKNNLSSLVDRESFVVFGYKHWAVIFRSPKDKNAQKIQVQVVDQFVVERQLQSNTKRIEDQQNRQQNGYSKNYNTLSQQLSVNNQSKPYIPYTSFFTLQTQITLGDARAKGYKSLQQVFEYLQYQQKSTIIANPSFQQQLRFLKNKDIRQSIIKIKKKKEQKTNPQEIYPMTQTKKKKQEIVLHFLLLPKQIMHKKLSSKQTRLNTLTFQLYTCKHTSVQFLQKLLSYNSQTLINFRDYFSLTQRAYEFSSKMYLLSIQKIQEKQRQKLQEFLINAMGEINNELKTIITKKRRRGKVLGRVSREEKQIQMLKIKSRLEKIKIIKEKGKHGKIRSIIWKDKKQEQVDEQQKRKIKREMPKNLKDKLFDNYSILGNNKNRKEKLEKKEQIKEKKQQDDHQKNNSKHRIKRSSKHKVQDEDQEELRKKLLKKLQKYKKERKQEKSHKKQRKDSQHIKSQLKSQHSRHKSDNTQSSQEQSIQHRNDKSNQTRQALKLLKLEGIDFAFEQPTQQSEKNQKKQKKSKIKKGKDNKQDKNYSDQQDKGMNISLQKSMESVNSDVTVSSSESVVEEGQKIVQEKPKKKKSSKKKESQPKNKTQKKETKKKVSRKKKEDTSKPKSKRHGSKTKKRPRKSKYDLGDDGITERDNIHLTEQQKNSRKAKKSKKMSEQEQMQSQQDEDGWKDEKVSGEEQIENFDFGEQEFEKEIKGFKLNKSFESSIEIVSTGKVNPVKKDKSEIEIQDDEEKKNGGEKQKTLDDILNEIRQSDTFKALHPEPANLKYNKVVPQQRMKKNDPFEVKKIISPLDEDESMNWKKMIEDKENGQEKQEGQTQQDDSQEDDMFNYAKQREKKYKNYLKMKQIKQEMIRTKEEGSRAKQQQENDPNRSIKRQNIENGKSDKDYAYGIVQNDEMTESETDMNRTNKKVDEIQQENTRNPQALLANISNNHIKTKSVQVGDNAICLSDQEHQPQVTFVQYCRQPPKKIQNKSDKLISSYMKSKSNNVKDPSSIKNKTNVKPINIEIDLDDDGEMDPVQDTKPIAMQKQIDTQKQIGKQNQKAVTQELPLNDTQSPSQDDDKKEEQEKQSKEQHTTSMTSEVQKFRQSTMLQSIPTQFDPLGQEPNPIICIYNPLPPKKPSNYNSLLQQNRYNSSKGLSTDFLKSIGLLKDNYDERMGTNKEARQKKKKELSKHQQQIANMTNGIQKQYKANFVMNKTGAQSKNSSPATISKPKPQQSQQGIVEIDLDNEDDGMELIDITQQAKDLSISKKHGQKVNNQSHVQTVPIKFNMYGGNAHSFFISSESKTFKRIYASPASTGINFQCLSLVHKIPNSGKHKLMARLVKKNVLVKKTVVKFGLIRDLPTGPFQSSIYKNYIQLRIGTTGPTTCAVSINQDGKQFVSKFNVQPINHQRDYIVMEVATSSQNGQLMVTWKLSNGGQIRHHTPPQMKSWPMVPFIAIANTQETWEFK